MLLWVSIASIVALSGCAAPAAPGIKGRWKPVNHYSTTTEAIPLNQAYLFYSSPMDGTLKTMLTRWAKDSKMTLFYQHPYDFTLNTAAAEIRTSDLQDAVSRLNAVYADQHVAISTDQNRIVVVSADSAPVGAGDAATTTP